MSDKPTTMFEKLTQDTQQAEEVIFIQRFRYEVYFDPTTQVFSIALVLPSGKRYTLPFGRLEFGSFVRDLNSSLEAVQNRAMEDSGNGSAIH